MKAVQIAEYGGLEVLAIVELPAPIPEPDEVVIAVAATSVNRRREELREGHVPGDPRLRPRGDHRRARRERDPVRDRRVALAETLVVARPAKLSMVEAAAIPTVAMTALLGLRGRAQVQAGQRVLVNGASSSVGLAAIQIARCSVPT